MKAEIYKNEGCKLMGAAFEVYNEQGYGLAGRLQPKGLPDISRGLSASDTPGTPFCEPFGFDLSCHMQLLNSN